MNTYNLLKRICHTRRDVNLKTLCSIKIGGIGRFVCYPKKIAQLKKLVKILKEFNIKYQIIGKGTNIVFSDGYSDIVFICTDKLNKIKIKNNSISAMCGVGLYTLNSKMCLGGIGGMEWSYGIPGSIGGAITMNAGAFGHEICEFVTKVLVIVNNRYKVITASDMQFGYRTSIIKNSDIMVVKANLSLFKSTTDLIKACQQKYLAERRNSQPYDKPSCGSVFFKTKDGSAGKTIDKLGLKGVKLGEVQISPKHANFFVNLGGAKSSDMRALIDLVKKKAEQNGIILQEEVIFI